MSLTSTLTQVSEKPAVLRAYAGRCLGRLVLALALTVFGMSFASSTAWSQVPHDMTYQGQLTDSVGAPLSGPVDLQLRIFDLLSGGSALYAEDHTGISLDDDGGFSVQLGAGSATSGTFGPSLFSGVNRYLEVVVDTDVLTPRQVLASVPWALVAEDVFFDPTNNIGTAITDAQNTANSALLDAATAAAGHTVDTTLDEAGVDAFVANNGYSTGAHTTNTDTQLTNSQVRDAALAQGFVMGAHTTDTKLNESQVDAYVANNGYSTGAHTTDTKLNESQVDAYVANNGYSTGAHTTDTKLNESQVDAFVANNGYSIGAHTTDTKLSESQVDAYVADNGYASASDVSTNTSNIENHEEELNVLSGLGQSAAVSILFNLDLIEEHIGNTHPEYNHVNLRNQGIFYSSVDVTAGDDLLANDDLIVGDDIVAGDNIYYDGGVFAHSDRRLKRNIEPIDDALDVVKDLRGVTFHRLDQGDGEPLHYGFIAQEVLEVVPDLVVLDSEGEYYSIDYVGFVGLLTVAIQEQSDQIAALEAQNEKLLRAKRSFSNRLKRIEDRLSSALD